MSIHRSILAGVSVAILLAGGCGSDTPAQQRPSTEALLGPAPIPQAQTPTHVPAGGATATPAPPPDNADLLAQRAQAYALELERQMHAPTPAPTAPGAAPSTTQASPVQPTDPRASDAPAAASPGSANQAARVPQTPAPAATSQPAPAPPAGSAPPGPPATATTSSDALGSRLAGSIRDNPRDIAGHLDYQLFQFLQDAQVPDLTAMADLPREDREMLAALLDGLSNFRSVVRGDNNMLLSRKIQPLLEMDARLRSQSELAIGTLALCTRVESFGVYEPIEPARFIAGREQSVIVYCAVENFASRFNDKKLWETRLTQETVLYTESGLNVWGDATTSIVDLSRQRRNDFFVVKMIKLPSNLTIGQYLLKVTLVDQQASRVAEATVPLRIVAR